MWRAAGNGMPHHCDALAALIVGPRFFVESSAPGDYHWHIVGGTLHLDTKVPILVSEGGGHRL